MTAHTVRILQSAIGTTALWVDDQPDPIVVGPSTTTYTGMLPIAWANLRLATRQSLLEALKATNPYPNLPSTLKGA